MKKLLLVVVIATLLLGVVPAVFATSVGSGVGVTIQTEKFPPQVWMCGDRVVSDDNTEPGRISAGGTALIERINNYAFEGEKVQWTVLVMDKNGVNKVKDVFATIGDSQGAGNNIEANCVEDLSLNKVLESCNARIGEEYITQFDNKVMRYYVCTLTVETPESMYGEYWATVEAVDLDDQSGVAAENEYWFFNPVIALKIDGEMSFENARPGADSYSKTILVGNDADAGSGVMLDMFVSGTDFYDSSSSGAMCPSTNQLSLAQFRYFATSGAYSTKTDVEAGRSAGTGAAVQPARNCDAEGYCNIGYGVGFNDPSPFYNGMEIIQAGPALGPYYGANVLAPGAEMALTFKLSLPEPCNGDFDSGKIFFWGEAI